MNNTDTGNSVDSIAQITQKLKDILSKYDIDYIPLAPNDQQIVYDIFLGKTLDINKAKEYSGDVLNYMGMYLKKVKNDTIEAIKYYRLSIDKGNADAMVNYAVLLRREERITEATKIYLMAIDKGNVQALYDYAQILGCDGDISEAKKYTWLAMEKGHWGAFNDIQDSYIKEYCGQKYWQRCEHNKNISTDFYEFLEIAYNNQSFKEDLCPMFRHLAEIYVSGLEYIDLHIQYSPDSSGAKQAKKDFTDRLVNLKDSTKVPTKDHQKDHK